MKARITANVKIGFFIGLNTIKSATHTAIIIAIFIIAPHSTNNATNEQMKIKTAVQYKNTVTLLPFVFRSCMACKRNANPISGTAIFIALSYILNS